MDRINELRAAENCLMWHDPEVEGDIKPLVDGYKVLNVRFEMEFRRSWSPSHDFKRWAKANNPGLLKEE